MGAILKTLLILPAILLTTYAYAPGKDYPTPPIQSVRSAQGMGQLHAENAQETYYQVNGRYYEAEQVLWAVSKFETGRGTQGVGRRNNPASIKCGETYCSYGSLAEGYRHALAVWQKSYLHLPLDSALARWKTGNKNDRSEATIRYINNIKEELLRI